MKKRVLIALTLIMMMIFCSCGVSESDISDAIDNRDKDALIELINTYNEEGTKADVLDNAVISAFDELCQSEDYTDFKFMEAVVDGIEGNTHDKLVDILEDNGEEKLKSFVVGEWVRMDYTDLDGCVIKIKWTDETGLATITDDSGILNNEFDFQENDLKWNEVQVIDSTSFKFDDLTKSDYGSAYMPSMATVNYEEQYISIHVTGSEGDYSSGTEQIWRPKKYVDSFGEKSVLKDADFKANGDTLKENEDILEGEPSDSFIFYWYDEKEDKSKEGVIKTNRGITLGSTEKDVIEAYGIGSMGIFDPKTDDYYKTTKGMGYDVWENMMKNQAEYFFVYFEKDRDERSLRFYFDKENQVCAIIYSNNLMDASKY